MINIRHDICVNAIEPFNLNGEILLIGPLSGGISGDFADLLLIISGFAITLLLGVLNVERIVAGSSRLMKTLNPHNVLARFRLWRSAHKIPH
jgi:hypothetical protein